MKGSTFKRCTCPEGRHCPRLKERRHGTWGYDIRVKTTAADGRTLRRGGFGTQTAAETALQQVNDLTRLAGGDDALERKIGDLIFDRSKRGGQLPAVEDVKRRLGLRRDLAASETTGEWLEMWFAGKRAKRESVKRSYRAHLDNWLIPHLGEVPLDRLSTEHIAAMLDQIETYNAEITAADGRGTRSSAGGRRTFAPPDHRAHDPAPDHGHASRRAQRGDPAAADHVEPVRRDRAAGAG